MTNKTKVRLSIRLQPELYELLCEITCLFPDFTSALEYALKSFENSPEHLACLEKIGDLRSHLLKMEQRFNTKND